MLIIVSRSWIQTNKYQILEELLGKKHHFTKNTMLFT